MKVRLFVLIFLLGFTFLFTNTFAQTNFPDITAKGIAIYGWKNGQATPIYLENEHMLFPIASLSKLATAKVAANLYLPDEVLTVTKSAAATLGSTPGIVVGAKYTRDDLLQALLVNSSNDAAMVLADTAGYKEFMARVNDFLHKNNYTETSFINPSGLDPSRKSKDKPNRMTPFHLTELLNDIYVNDPVLSSFMEEESAEITNQHNGQVYTLKQTNALFRDDYYKNKIVMSKTGLTNMAGQNLAFVAPGNDQFDYLTVVFLGAVSRNIDAKKIVDWLDVNYKLAQTKTPLLTQK